MDFKHVQDYVNQLPEDRRFAIEKLRDTLKQNLPKELEECISYGMIGYVVPHSLFPEGYHCSPELPLPFINLASQKNFIALYHMGIYGDSQLLEWFQNEYPKHSKLKLDMGKSCIRFKKMDQIPYELIAELARKVTVSEYIMNYKKMIKK